MKTESKKAGKQTEGVQAIKAHQRNGAAEQSAKPAKTARQISAHEYRNEVHYLKFIMEKTGLAPAEIVQQLKAHRAPKNKVEKAEKIIDGLLENHLDTPEERIAACERIRLEWQSTYELLSGPDIARMMAAGIDDKSIVVNVPVKMKALAWQQLVVVHVDRMWNEREQIVPLKVPDIADGGPMKVVGEAVGRLVEQSLHRIVSMAPEMEATR